MSQHFRSFASYRQRLLQVSPLTVAFQMRAIRTSHGYTWRHSDIFLTAFAHDVYQPQTGPVKIKLPIISHFFHIRPVNINVTIQSVAKTPFFRSHTSVNLFSAPSRVVYSLNKQLFFDS